MRKIRRFQFGGSVSGGGLKGIQQTAQGLIGTVNEFSNALINGVSGGGGGGYGGGFGGGFSGTNPYAAPSTPPASPVYPNIPSPSAYPNISSMPPGFTGPGFDFGKPQFWSGSIERINRQTSPDAIKQQEYFNEINKTLNLPPPNPYLTDFGMGVTDPAEREALNKKRKEMYEAYDAWRAGGGKDLKQRAAAAGLADDFGKTMPPRSQYGFGNDMIEGPYNPNIPGIAGLAGQGTGVAMPGAPRPGSFPLPSYMSDTFQGQARATPANPFDVMNRMKNVSSSPGTPSLRNDAIEGAYNPNIPRMTAAPNTNPLTGNFSNTVTGNRLNPMKAGGVVKKATTKAKPAAKPKAKAKSMYKPVAKKLSPTRGDGIAQRGKTKGRMV